MSTKKTSQKPATSKPETAGDAISKPDAGPVDGTIETKAEAPAEVASAEPVPAEDAAQPPVDPSVDAGDQSPAATAPTEPQEEDDEDDLMSEEEESDEPEAFAPSAPQVQRDPLTIRLSKAVNGMLTSGDPASVQALHKLEMAVGDLKNALPAAIDASAGLADEWLKADLTSLLTVL